MKSKVRLQYFVRDCSSTRFEKRFESWKYKTWNYEIWYSFVNPVMLGAHLQPLAGGLFKDVLPFSGLEALKGKIFQFR